MGMSEYYGPTDWDESIATIHRALDLGVTFLDTADMYGVGPQRGAGRPGHRTTAATRSSSRPSSASTARGGDGNRAIRGERDYVKRPRESSLLRLGVDVIDLYYLHRRRRTPRSRRPSARWPSWCAEGKVRYLGLSEVDGDLLRRAHAVHPIAAVQSEYSLWTRDAGDRRAGRACASSASAWCRTRRSAAAS